MTAELARCLVRIGRRRPLDVVVGGHDGHASDQRKPGLASASLSTRCWARFASSAATLRNRVIGGYEHPIQVVSVLGNIPVPIDALNARSDTLPGRGLVDDLADQRPKAFGNRDDPRPGGVGQYDDELPRRQATRQGCCRGRWGTGIA